MHSVDLCNAHFLNLFSFHTNMLMSCNVYTLKNEILFILKKMGGGVRWREIK